jgi:ABC-2 type transport system permease protein
MAPANRPSSSSAAWTGSAGVELHGDEMVVTAADGAATIGRVAVALEACGAPVRDLTLRTPTLDDVFLELTGGHIRTPTGDEAAADGPPDDAPRARRDHRRRMTTGDDRHDIEAPTPSGPTRVERATRRLRPRRRLDRRPGAARLPRDLEAVMPPVFIAFFFFVVNIATLQRPDRGQHRRVRLPVVHDGDRRAARRHRCVPRACAGDRHPERLLRATAAHPIRRLAILLGHMLADVTVAAALTVPVMGLGFALGVRFPTGFLGLVAFMALAALWSLAFSGFGYAIALKTGNPAAVNSTFLLFFPFLFLTSSYVPRDQLSWLARRLQPRHLPVACASTRSPRRCGRTCSARRARRSPHD